MTSTFKFSYCAGLAGLDGLRARWQSLFARAVNPVFYNDFRWHKALQQHLFQHPLHYLLVEQNNAPVAIIPLQISAKAHLGIPTQYLHLPHHVAADLRDIVLDQDADVGALYPALLNYLRHDFPQRWDLLEWRDFTPRSGLFRLLQGKPANGIAEHTEVAGQSVFARSTADAPLTATVSAKQIRNAERLLRKAEAISPVDCLEIVAPEEMAEGYQAFVSVEQAGWKGEQGSAIAHNPERKAFYQALATDFGATGQASIRLLKIGNEVAAGQFGLRGDNTLHLLKIGYNESLASLGPGSAIMLRSLQSESERGLAELNLVTSPAWANRWHFESEPKLRALEFNGNLLGRLLKLGRQHRQKQTIKRTGRKDFDGLNSSP